MSDTERAYMYYLFGAPGIGSKRGRLLLDAFGSAQNIYRNAGKAAELLGGGSTGGRFLAYSGKISPEKEYERIRKAGIGFTAFCFEDFPEKLKTIPDPPLGITWLGRLPDSRRPAVSIIGARACSDYGRYMAKRFGSDLAAAGVQVISGMAVGVDGLSQTAALAAGGESFGILGSGVDVCYPEENQKLYRDLIGSGGVISEYCPGTLPSGRNFPPRNRIISALCDVLLVIEARKRSGTFITVDMALEQGKEIFAVPGRVTDALSDGCNQLIKTGAGVALSAADITEVLFSVRIPEGCSSSVADRFPSLSRDELIVAGCLDLTPKSVNTICDDVRMAGTPLSVPEIMEIIVELCMTGVAVQEGGGFRLRLES